MPRAGRLTAAGAMAVGKSEKWRPYAVSDRPTEAAAVEDVVCHDVCTTFVGGRRRSVRAVIGRETPAHGDLGPTPAAPHITIGGLQRAREALRIADRRG